MIAQPKKGRAPDEKRKGYKGRDPSGISPSNAKLRSMGGAGKKGFRDETSFSRGRGNILSYFLQKRRFLFERRGACQDRKPLPVLDYKKDQGLSRGERRGTRPASRGEKAQGSRVWGREKNSLALPALGGKKNLPRKY